MNINLFREFFHEMFGALATATFTVTIGSERAAINSNPSSTPNVLATASRMIDCEDVKIFEVTRNLFLKKSRSTLFVPIRTPRRSLLEATNDNKKFMGTEAFMLMEHVSAFYDALAGLTCCLSIFLHFAPQQRRKTFSQNFAYLPDGLDFTMFRFIRNEITANEKSTRADGL